MDIHGRWVTQPDQALPILSFSIRYWSATTRLYHEVLPLPRLDPKSCR